MMQPWAYFNLVAFHVGSSQFQLGVLKVRNSFEKTLFTLPKYLKQDIFILPKKIKKQFETRNINLSRTNFSIFFSPKHCICGGMVLTVLVLFVLHTCVAVAIEKFR